MASRPDLGTIESVTFAPQMRHRFSVRTGWDRSASELQEAAFAATAGSPVLDLTSSSPANCGLHPNAAEVLAPFRNEAALRYLPDPRGLLSAREAITGYYAGHHASISPAQIILTASTSEAYSHLFRLLCDVGDEVLMAQPSYPLFDYLADLCDVTLRSYPLFYDYGWWIDIAELERSITSRTRAIIVVHPNNPTGHFTSDSERTRLFELCRRYGLCLIVDEVFLDYSHDAASTAQSFAASQSSPLTFVLSGLSKIAALPQMKVGWLLAIGPEADREEALARLEIIADTFLSVSTPAQLAVAAWLRASPSVQRRLLDRIGENTKLLRDAGLDIFDVAAGWSVILRLPRLFNGQTAFETLRKQAIMTHPAHFYGLQDVNQVVLSLITPVETMRQAIRRISALCSWAQPDA